jgi:hypothetical protein
MTNDEIYTELAKLQSRAQSGGLMDASREDLERYGRLLTTAHATVQIGPALYPQICEFVRLLLLVRMSEESERRALGVANSSLEVSRASLGEAKASKTIAWAALIIGGVIGVAQIIVAAIGAHW